MQLVIQFAVAAAGLLAFFSLILWAGALHNWARLAAEFQSPALPNGTRFRSASGHVGNQLIVGGLTVVVSDDGLGLCASLAGLRAPFHPPLLIPWSSISSDTSGKSRHKFPLVVATSHGVVAVELDGAAGRAVRKFIEARSIPAEYAAHS